MYKFLKWIYFIIPFKRELFIFFKPILPVGNKLAGYLKFQGEFKLNIEEGKSISVYNNNLTLASIVFWRGIDNYERQSIALWLVLAKGAKEVFDIGANFGLFGLIAQGINSDASVSYFEPLKRNCNLISKNTQLNDFVCEIEIVAISDHIGTTTFYDMDSDENTIGSLDREFVERHAHHKKIKPVSIDVITLDSYIDSNNIRKIDLLKIDVEGAECNVFKGFKKNIKTMRPNILMEISSKKNADEINLLIAELDYEIYEVDESMGLLRKTHIENSVNRNYLLYNRSTDALKNYQFKSSVE